jgi:hypothetical protein
MIIGLQSILVLRRVRQRAGRRYPDGDTRRLVEHRCAVGGDRDAGPRIAQVFVGRDAPAVNARNGRGKLRCHLQSHSTRACTRRRLRSSHWETVNAKLCVHCCVAM